mmetsp:Transcript_69721/g.123712  ORF Transcript_69721/g.123712 Transcript_69721/m.123712 type:complete len:221 (-) Transcript_69721:1278-1940(-)
MLLMFSMLPAIGIFFGLSPLTGPVSSTPVWTIICAILHKNTDRALPQSARKAVGVARKAAGYLYRCIDQTPPSESLPGIPLGILFSLFTLCLQLLVSLGHQLTDVVRINLRIPYLIPIGYVRWQHLHLHRVNHVPQELLHPLRVSRRLDLAASSHLEVDIGWVPVASVVDDHRPHWCSRHEGALFEREEAIAITASSLRKEQQRPLPRLPAVNMRLDRLL